MSENTTSDSQPITATRRALLCGAGGAALVLCGGPSTASASTPASAGPRPGASGSTSQPKDSGSARPITSGTDRPTDPGTDSGGGTVLGKAADVPQGGGKIFKDKKIVVTQPAAGEYHAFSAVCTHEGCTVSTVTGGTINCPCHGSKFSIEDGTVRHGPAQSPLPRKAVHVKDGNLVIGS